MARLLLVFVLGLGVAWMHALGHPAEHDCPAGLAPAGGHWAATRQSGTASPAATADQAAPSVLAAPTARSLTAGLAALARKGGGHGPCGDPTAMCLAVLTLGGILLGLASLRRRHAGPVAPASAGFGAWRPGMLDPPSRTGLTLARVSVLRI